MRDASPGRLVSSDTAPAFAHASEAEFARILDFYAVPWEYEPHTFPIMWNLDGAVVESFTPDFYLPEFELYVELTTLRQKLVRKKNRKLRRLRELYPEVRIKLFYGRDFRMLLLKFGRVGLLGELTGTVGQVVPARDADDVVGDAPGRSRETAASEAASDATRELDTAPVVTTSASHDDDATVRPADLPRSRNARRRRRRAEARAEAQRQAG